MLKENLVMLRNIHGFSQEEIAEKIDISRQAYAKWESGATKYVIYGNKCGKGKTLKLGAKAKGSCYVYAYAQNGVAKKIKVVVK